MVYDVCSLYPDVVIVSSSNFNGFRGYLIPICNRLISGTIENIYWTPHRLIYRNSNSGKRSNDSDGDGSRVGTALTIADGVGEAVGAGAARVWCVSDIAAVIDDPAVSPPSY